MITYLELNERYGYGYQARMVIDGIESVIDDEPYTLGDISAGTIAAIKEINQKTGKNFDPCKVIHITEDALEANKNIDITSARFAKDRTGEYIVPAKQDVKISDDGEELISPRGVVLMAYEGWKTENIGKCKDAVRRYCQYLALHGYGKRAHEIFSELEEMDEERANDWIKATFKSYVSDEMGAVNYIMDV